MISKFGISVGGSAEKAMLLAEQVLHEPIDMLDILRIHDGITLELSRRDPETTT